LAIIRFSQRAVKKLVILIIIESGGSHPAPDLIRGTVL
jgi:hypothetical protein